MAMMMGTINKRVTTIATQSQTVSPPGLFAGSFFALKYANQAPTVAATQMINPHIVPPLMIFELLTLAPTLDDAACFLSEVEGG